MKQILILLFSLLLFTVSYGQNILAEHHFESGGITEVSVIGTFCDVVVSKGDQVVFDGLIEGSGDKGDFIIASIKNDDVVVFKVESKVSNWWSGNNIKRARLNLSVPDNVVLKIDNTSGDVRVSNLNGDNYRIETTSGDISINKLSGVTSVSSTSGDIDIEALMGHLTLRTTSGDQRLYSITGSINTRSTSGDMDISKLEGNLDAGSTSGDIELLQLNGSVSIESTSGDIDASSVYLTGDSKAKASSGDISFHLLNDLKDVGFDLRASSGELEVGSVSAEDQLTLNRGTVLFKAVTTSGDQEYYN